MELHKTERLLQEKMNTDIFDSYAVLVGIGDQEKLLTSPNVNEYTYFDAASMGKVLVTSTLILRALGEGRLHLEDTLDSYFDRVPEEKQKITIQQMLTHSSGIVRRIPVPQNIADEGRESIKDFILENPLAFAPGTDYTYSCNAYILLGFILEKIYDMRLDQIFDTYLGKPLGLTHACFNLPIDAPNSAVCYRRKEVGVCRCDDESAYTMRGTGGNGASFWGISDIQKFIHAVLAKDERLYPKHLFDLAEQDYTPDYAEGRGLGYLMVDERYLQTGDLFPAGSFGHCGHTGMSFFMNRELNLYVIILTNATRFANMRSGFNGYDYGEIMALRAEIHNTIKEDLTAQGRLYPAVP